jgi:hypothetical protein
MKRQKKVIMNILEIAGLSKEMRLIFEGGALYRTSSMKHYSALQAIQKRGVAFKDIQAHLGKQAKKLGLWETDKASGDFTAIKKLADKRVKWAKDIQLFLDYVKRNWDGYDKKKVKKELTTAEKRVAHQKKLMTAIDLLMEEFAGDDELEALARIKTIITES